MLLSRAPTPSFHLPPERDQRDQGAEEGDVVSMYQDGTGHVSGDQPLLPGTYRAETTTMKVERVPEYV